MTTPEIAPIPALEPKTKLSGKVLKTTLAGALVDVGQSIPGVIHISQLSKDAINKVDDVVKEGQMVDVWVRRVKKDRIELTMIQPLGLEWKEIEPDMVVKGKVVRLETYGAFVEIGAERPGMIHVSELAHGYVKTPNEIVKEGDEIEAKVLDVDRKKKQIKLSMKALLDKPEEVIKTVLNKPEKKEVKEREKEPEAPEEEKEAPIPTAMEMALRQAMDKKGVHHVGDLTGRKKRKPSSKRELEDIYSRTLKNRSR